MSIERPKKPSKPERERFWDTKDIDDFYTVKGIVDYCKNTLKITLDKVEIKKRALRQQHLYVLVYR